MSLVVSLRVADGIVAAADSLSTSQNVLQFAAQNIEFECPHCKQKVAGQSMQLPPLGIPISASSYTQKLFSLFGRYALSSFGLGIINERSIYYHVNQFQGEHKNDSDHDLPRVLACLIEYFEKELVAQFPKFKDEAPADWRPISFHLNGFEKENERWVGVTYEAHVGKNNEVKRNNLIGCTIGGYLEVVQKLWEIGKGDPLQKFKYPLFSLQDAVDLSEFLVSSTSTFQRFANQVQTVGGEIDVGLLTPFHGFQWIKRKRLTEVLEKGTHREHE